MRVRKCYSCGANLPDPKGAATQECPYCHAINEVSGPKKPVVSAEEEEPATTGSPIVFYAFLGVMGVVMCAGVGGTVVMTLALPPAVTAIAIPMNPETQWVPQLPDRGHVDPIAAMPIALEAARAWRTDVVPYGFSATGVRAPGTVDLSPSADPENEVVWYFYSPAAYQARAVARSGDFVLVVRLSPKRDLSHGSDYGAPYEPFTFPTLACDTRQLLSFAMAADPTLAQGALYDLVWASPPVVQVRRTGFDAGSGAYVDPAKCRPTP